MKLAAVRLDHKEIPTEGGCALLMRHGGTAAVDVPMAEAVQEWRKARSNGSVLMITPDTEDEGPRLIDPEHVVGFLPLPKPLPF